jgi:hypothetical protein
MNGLKRKYMISIKTPTYCYDLSNNRALCLLSTLTSVEDFEFVKSQISKERRVTLQTASLIKYIQKILTNMRRKNTPTKQVYLNSVIPTKKFQIYIFTYLEYQRIFENIKNVGTVTIIPHGGS